MRTLKQWGPIIAVLAIIGGFVYYLTDGDLGFLVRARTEVTVASQDDRTVELVSVLPRDAIPAIDDPEFLPASQSNYAPNELVIGVAIDGEARAYSIPYLSRHEIVNDSFGDTHISVTW